MKRDPSPSVPPNTCPGAQNLKTSPDGFGTAQKESGTSKHENEPPPDTLGNVENESGSAKLENVT
jgi:hypothetical protein